MPKPKPLQHILQSMSQQYLWQTASATRVIAQVWLEIVGPVVAHNTRVMKYEDGTIKLAVASSAWAQELQYLTPTLISRLNEHLAVQFRVKNIRSRVWVRAFLTEGSSSTRKERTYRVRSINGAHDEDLQTLLSRVRELHRQAVKEWLESGYHQCAVCQSPTLEGYSVCSACGSQFSSRGHNSVQ